MVQPSDEIGRAINAIRNARLPHPDGELLERFIQDSADRKNAASFILQDTSEERLESFIKTWKATIRSFLTDPTADPTPFDNTLSAKITTKNSGTCCITGLQHSFWDPLVVTRILSWKSTRDHEKTLAIFLGQDLLKWLQDPDKRQQQGNYWLVRRSVAKAFSQGFFEIEFEEDLDYTVWKNLIGGANLPTIVDNFPDSRNGSFRPTTSSNINPPDVSAIKIMSQFSKSIRWYCVGQDIANRKTTETVDVQAWQPWRPILYHFRRITFAIWRIFPATIRILTYRGLSRVGVYLYGPTSSLRVQQLPFGMFLKTIRLRNHGVVANEYGALHLVQEHTKVPVPQPLDLVSDSRASYLLTSRCTGDVLGTCIDTLSDEEARCVVRDLRDMLVDLRKISKRSTFHHGITNAIGEACYDGRITSGLDYDQERGDFFGPFKTEDDFNKTLQIGALPGISHRNGHAILFTHGDLNQRNIMLQGTRITGIIDWETAGWYPEYWEYTKARFSTKLSHRWLRMVDEVFGELGDYSEELEIERKFWDYCY